MGVGSEAPTTTFPGGNVDATVLSPSDHSSPNAVPGLPVGEGACSGGGGGVVGVTGLDGLGGAGDGDGSGC